LCVLFDSPLHAGQSPQTARRWSVFPLLEESLYCITRRQGAGPAMPSTMVMADLKDMPLILPTGPHGLRSALDAAFARARIVPRVVMEIDSLTMLMEAVDGGLGATLQPWAAVGRFSDAADRFHLARLTDKDVRRGNVLCSLSDDELSPAALATRVVLTDCARALVTGGLWGGATLSHHNP
jgi:LysR family transcriptional regulator, regulatory protein for tcuABC